MASAVAKRSACTRVAMRDWCASRKVVSVITALFFTRPGGNFFGPRFCSAFRDQEAARFHVRWGTGGQKFRELLALYSVLPFRISPRYKAICGADAAAGMRISSGSRRKAVVTSAGAETRMVDDISRTGCWSLRHECKSRRRYPSLASLGNIEAPSLDFHEQRIVIGSRLRRHTVPHRADCRIRRVSGTVEICRSRAAKFFSGSSLSPGHLASGA